MRGEFGPSSTNIVVAIPSEKPVVSESQSHLCTSWTTVYALLQLDFYTQMCILKINPLVLICKAWRACVETTQSLHHLTEIGTWENSMLPILKNHILQQGTTQHVIVYWQIFSPWDTSVLLLALLHVYKKRGPCPVWKSKFKCCFTICILGTTTTFLSIAITCYFAQLYMGLLSPCLTKVAQCAAWSGNNGTYLL